MVARRKRTKPAAAGLTPYKRGLAALAQVPVSDEDPAAFWGPDWQEKLAEAEADIAAGRGLHADSTEEFFAQLEAQGADGADL